MPFAHPRVESLHESPEFGAIRSHVRELVMKEYAAQAPAVRSHVVKHQQEEMTMGMNRREFLETAGAGAAALGLAALGAPAFAQARTKVRVGYLHTLAVDGQMWLAQHLGAWAKHGLEPDFKQFTTGLELFQAMVGGSIDMLSTGAVISNFPARGQGKMFLVNCVEFATAQLWVRTDQGVKDFGDLKGKRIATTTGTTAHVFLDNALRANKLDPAKDVEILNQRMAEAVTSFISGAVPAVALWVPFNVTVRDKVLPRRSWWTPPPTIRRRRSSPGWAASNEYYAKNQEVLARVIRAWRREIIFWSGSPTRRSRSCRRTLPAGAAARPRSSSARRRCSRRRNGGSSTRTARSPVGCSRSLTSSCGSATSRTRRPPSSTSTPRSISIRSRAETDEGARAPRRWCRGGEEPEAACRRGNPVYP